MKTKENRYCVACSMTKQKKFFISEEYFYCKSCCNKKPELKKWRKINGYVVKV